MTGARLRWPAVAVALLSAGPAPAQMMLPGANNGNQAGAPPRETGGTAGGPTMTPVRPVVVKPPSEDTILGHPLARDGKEGAMSFERAGADIQLTRLTFAGDKISRPQETCTVDVSMTAPITLKAVGRPVGALRYEVPLTACPFTIDVLDGAALVSRAEPTCAFKERDCQVAPTGLWGPHAADITPKQAKDLEHNRPRIETTMRQNFRALLKKAGKDRAEVKAIAREQAAFSSDREVMCRDYDQEPVHGFCSTQIAQARALALLAKYGPFDDKAKTKPKAKQPKVPAPQEAPAADDSAR